MISLLDKNLEEAKKYHGVEANAIFDKIINNANQGLKINWQGDKIRKK